MILVVGSRHDAVAIDLAGKWRHAVLCSAEDLAHPGWVWPSSVGAGRRVWVVEGVAVADSDVSGVFVRRATVYAEELTGTHPDDRAYLAAEAHAFLAHVLHSTEATVVNPVDDGGSFGEAALRPERWMAVAASLDVPVAPLRLRSDGPNRPAHASEFVEVVDGTALGRASAHMGEAAAALCQGMRLRWAVAAFDVRARLVAITTMRPPSSDAAGHLGRLLEGSRAV